MVQIPLFQVQAWEQNMHLLKTYILWEIHQLPDPNSFGKSLLFLLETEH